MFDVVDGVVTRTNTAPGNKLNFRVRYFFEHSYIILNIYVFYFKIYRNSAFGNVALSTRTLLPVSSYGLSF